MMTWQKENRMRTRTLGNTGLQLTTIGIGTWAIGGGDWLFGWGPQDEREAIEAIRRGVELGINWIDTAPVYGGGRSEQLVGQALAELDSASRPLIATKCSRIIRPDGKIDGVLDRESILHEAEDSLRRLRVEAIDLYQIHWPMPEQDLEEGWSAMAELVRQGKVRHIGVSNFNIEQLQRIQPIHPIASLQPPYSMLVRGIEKDVLAYCQRHDIGIIAYSPMYKGLLTGAFTRERALSLGQDDHRSRDPRFRPPQLDVHLSLVESLRPIADRHGKSLAELAIAWVLRRPEVTAAIVGARRPDQIEGSIGAGDWELPEQDIQQIDQLLGQHAQALQQVR
jgi:aryl-alcohol dehydrogenase-like predicted oxidoreductase